MRKVVTKPEGWEMDETMELAKSDEHEIESITVGDLLGNNERRVRSVDRLMTVALGDIDGLSMITKMSRPAAVMWNEHEITLLNPSRNTFIIFKPELSDGIKGLFDKEGKKREGGFFMPSYNVWEGECESLQLGKKKLIEFFSLYALEVPPEISAAIKSMRIKTVKSESETIDLDDEKKSSIVDEETSTNIPKKFKARMQISRDFQADVQFSCQVVNKKNDYGRDTNEKCIELRVLNYRDVLRDMMDFYLRQLPDDIPKVYGTMRLGDAPTGRY